MSLTEDFGRDYINAQIDPAKTIFPPERETREQVVNNLKVAQQVLAAIGFNPNLEKLSIAYKKLSERMISLLEAGIPLGEYDPGEFSKYYHFNNSAMSLFADASMHAMRMVSDQGKSPNIIPTVRAAEIDRQTKFLPPTMIMAFARSFAESDN
jgi:hypothetical protein